VIAASVDVEIAIEIGRHPEAVWALVSDPMRWPEWVDEFEEVVPQADGPVGEGSVFRYTVRPGHRSATIEIVEWEPGHRFAWDGPPLPWHGGSARPRGFMEVTTAGEGHTRLVSRYQPELFGTMALLRPYLRRWLRRQRLKDAKRLKALLETHAER
jgi:uncharacterized protein YndB with AHSA1/START domain